ncbi:MAG: hypothetical protein Q9222_003092 [Ikaeria aurantiellina]
MASDSAAKTVNGNYGAQQLYGSSDQQMSSQGFSNAAGVTQSGPSGAEPHNTSYGPTAASATSAEGSSHVPKDEVGWYFVEQYYTTLSKNPEKLHLFYNKRSQFVSGVEAEKVSVSVGQRVCQRIGEPPDVLTNIQQAINERIKELDIQDCKVRVSNVDSQESFKNIVVQVIGEMSNKAAPHRKFVQTFVLAEQPNGYFVLNDIFRYIEDEEEDFESEEPPATQAAGTEELPATLTSSDNPVEQRRDAEEVDHKLQAQLETTEEAAPEEPTSEAPATNGTAVEAPAENEKEDEPATTASITDEQNETVPGSAEKSLQEEAAVEPEKPKDPDPTPVASPPKPSQAAPTQAQTPAAPPKPAAPKTWANLVAANRVAPPAVPSPAPSASPAPSQPKNAPTPSTQSTNAAPATPDDGQPRGQQSGNAGWQTAGPDSNRRQARGQSISGNTDRETIHGYVKNVTDKVDASILKGTLNQFGKLAYFDVSRQKNCAFVEFETLDGYNAAVAANPHSIGGEQIFVEERRPRPAGYGGFNPRGGMRGGRGGADNRAGGQGRGNFSKDGGRGGFVPRGRGNMTPRGGRGQPQAA